MKHKIKIFLAIFSLLCTGLQFFASGSTVFAATSAQDCYNNYNGAGTGTGTNGKLSAKLSADYAKSGCDANAKSGAQNCQESTSSQGALITCTKPADNSVGAGCAAQGLVQSSVDTSCVTPTTTDPALAGCPKDDAAAANEQACGLIGKYVNPLIQVLSAAVGVAVAIAIAYGGILYSTSGGDQARVTKAKSLIRNAVLSLVAFVFLYSFVQFIVPGGIFNK